MAAPVVVVVVVAVVLVLVLVLVVVVADGICGAASRLSTVVGSASFVVGTVPLHGGTGATLASKRALRLVIVAILWFECLFLATIALPNEQTNEKRSKEWTSRKGMKWTLPRSVSLSKISGVWPSLEWY